MEKNREFIKRVVVLTGTVFFFSYANKYFLSAISAEPTILLVLGLILIFLGERLA